MGRAELSLVALKRDPFWLVLLILFPLLVFPNLGNIFLWQDEGETAVLAQCVLLHGYPLAHDGRQVVSDQADQRDLKNGVWIWTPWLPIYLAASSLALFGPTTWAARFPFVLAAWAAVLLSYLAFFELTGSRRLSRFASLLFATSVPFLLHARQCRYYSLLTLFALLHVWGYARILRGARFGFALIVLSGAGLAQTFLPQLVASTAALGTHALLVAKNRAAFKKFAIASAAVASISLPFFIYSAAWNRDYDNSGHGYDNAGRFMASFRSYVLMLHAYTWPFVLAVPLAWRRLAAHPKARARLLRALLAGFCVLVLFALGTTPGAPSFAASWVVSAVLALLGLGALARYRRDPAAASDWRPLLGLVMATTVLLSAALCPYPFFRYLLGILPFAALFSAYTAGELVRWNPVGLTVAGALLIGTNVLSQGPFVAFARIQTPKTGDVRTWLDQAMSYGYRPANIPAVNVSRFASMIQPWSLSPLLDYAGELTHDYDGPIEAVVRELGASARPGQVVLTTYEHFPLMFYTGLTVLKHDQAQNLTALPDWIFLHSPTVPRLPAAIASAFGTNYTDVKLATKEVNWENIPEPYWHFYRTRSDGRNVALFRKHAD